MRAGAVLEVDCERRGAQDLCIGALEVSLAVKRGDQEIRATVLHSKLASLQSFKKGVSLSLSLNMYKYICGLVRFHVRVFESGRIGTIFCESSNTRTRCQSGSLEKKDAYPFLI